MRPFLDTYAALILRLARSVVKGSGERVEADDVAHEVFVTLLDKSAHGAFDPERIENVEAYLRVVVRNAAHRARLRAKRGGELTRQGDVEILVDGQRESATEPGSHALDARATLEALKKSLRPRDAAAFALLVEDGLTIEETAATLGTTANNVYQMRYRILAAAREIAGQDAPARAFAETTARGSRADSAGAPPVFRPRG